MRNIKFLFLVIILFASSNISTSYSQSTKGKDFWFGFMYNLIVVQPQVYISSDAPASGTITVPGIGFTQNFNLPGGTTQKFTLPLTAVTPYTEGTHNLAVHVQSCEEITVYAVNPGNASADATIVIPTSALGSQYYALNMSGSPGDWGDAALIVATENNTSIEIIPSVNTDGGKPAGVPFTITLNQGESYQLTHLSGTADLTGTSIKASNNGGSCKPFAVFSGSQCINIGGCVACDHLYEQLLPNNSLGKTYAAIPHAQRNRTHYRVLAIQNNTKVYLNGTLVTTLNAGQFYQYGDNNFTLITADNPVMVMQYAEGTSCGGPGDPFEVLLYPVEQSLENITFNAFQTPLVTNYWINVLVKTVNVPTVVLDGANVSGSFSPFPADPTYSYARISVTQGDHTLSSPGGATTTVYGWGNAESFGYCAGAAIKDLTNDFDIVTTPNCPNSNINFSATTSPLVTSYTWDFGDGSANVADTIATHSYPQAGSYNVTLTMTKTNACAVVVKKPVDIFDLPIRINQNDTAVCSGMTFNLSVNLSDSFQVVQVTGCNDTILKNVYMQYDNVYWSTGQTGTSIQITPTSDTMIYVYGEQTGSDCTAIDSVFIQVQNLDVDFDLTNVCQGNQVCLTNQSTTNQPIVNSRYNLDGTLLTSNNLDYCFTGTNSGTFNVKLYIETSIGCRDSITKQLTIFPKPTADFTFTNVCKGNQLNLNNTTSVTGNGTMTYTWDVDNNGTTDYTTQNIQHQYPNSGVYTVNLIATTADGCKDTVDHQVTVYALPIANFTATSVCEDDVTNLTDGSTITPVDNDVISTYAWNFGNGSTSNQQNPTVSYGQENVYNVSLVVTTNYGCKDTVTLPVTVYPLPHVNFSPTDVCLNFATQFSDNSTISNAHTSNSNVQWAWDFADGTTSTQQNPSHTYASDGSYNATLTVTSNHNCVNDTTIKVTVYPLPVASFVGQNLEGCAPLCPTITSTSTVNSPSILSKYEWTLSNGKSYSGNSFTDCFDNITGMDVSYDVNLKVTSDKGCVSQTSTPNYIKVYHNPIADFYFTPSNPDVINPDVDFHNTSLYANSYYWVIGDNISSEFEPDVEFPYEPKIYDVLLIASTDKGCTDTARSVVDVKDKVIFYIPNTFTPDHDEYNEMFKPIFASGYDPQTYTLLIFDRWGEIIFESHDVNVGWKGTYGVDSNTIVKDGTYLWKIDFKETMSDKHHTYTGHVNVLK
ncbi:MAG: PKD domain-containing protein [Brumimicrobium sp.]|nr:PKD domain-containing protein [Brumimicrobium sp.]